MHTLYESNSPTSILLMFNWTSIEYIQQFIPETIRILCIAQVKNIKLSCTFVGRTYYIQLLCQISYSSWQPEGQLRQYSLSTLFQKVNTLRVSLSDVFELEPTLKL